MQITEPSWLTDVGGWVERAALAEPRKPGEKRTFIKGDVYWDKGRDLELGERYAKANAAHRSSVDFSVFGAGITEHANGRATVLSTFTAKNSFGLELEFSIRCLLDSTGLIEGHISES